MTDYTPLTDDEIRRGKDGATNTPRFLFSITDDGVSWSDAAARWNPEEGWHHDYT